MKKCLVPQEKARERSRRRSYTFHHVTSPVGLPDTECHSMHPNLDYVYGPAIDPQPRASDQKPYKKWEEFNIPISRYKLDSTTAIFLRQVMDEIENGWRLGEVLFCEVAIIWVVDEEGEIWFALEELVLRGLPSGHPRHKNLILKEEDADKLGHPALIGCRKGRIAGEITFDTNDDLPQWVIDPYSGRYGIHHTRRRQHLQNAKEKFAGLGFRLIIDDSYFLGRTH